MTREIYNSTLSLTLTLDGEEGVSGQRHAPAALPLGKRPVPIIQESGWAPGLFWAGAENFALSGIRSTARSASSESFNVFINIIIYSLKTLHAHLTFYSLLLTCTIRFNTYELTFFPHCIYVFCIYLRTNSDLCPI